jgi:hypothetical protein
MEIHGHRTRERQADADTLRALYMAMLEGWNRGSGEAFARPSKTNWTSSPSTARAFAGGTS